MDLLKAWNGIHGAAIAAHVRVLASDEYEGRAPGTRGEELSLAYIHRAFQSAGLVAPGPQGYAQDVPLLEATVTGTPRFSLQVGATHLTPLLHDAFVPRLGGPRERVAITGSELVFGGYGAVAPEYDWNDYEGVDLTGTTVILLRGDPGTATGDNALFAGGAATRHTVSTIKCAEAARRGARAVIVVHTDASAGHPWSLLSGGGLGASQHFLEPEAAEPEPEAVVHASEGTARAIFDAAGSDFDTEVRAAAKRGFRAHPLGGTADIALDAHVRRIVSHNLIGLVPGTEAPDESVLLLAHWDHMGKNPSLRGDPIFNGAVDNATGVAALIEIARAFHAMPRAPRRTVVLVATTAEERGLLGAEYYARHPVRPLAKTAVAVAVDALFPFGAFDHMTVTGFGNTELEDILAPAAARLGRRLQDDGEPQLGAFFRSDAYPFLRRGVPGFQAVGTPDNAKPETDPQMAAVLAYVRTRYHQTADQYDAATWDMAGIEGDARILFEFAWRLADETRFPNWRWSSPFRAIGDSLRRAHE
jgi:Zn-dependent M28 family amino/carboxypeptidase